MYTVANLMTRDLVTLGPFDDLSLAETILALGGIRHLPVVEQNQRLVGLISQRDLLRACSNVPPETQRTRLAREVMTVHLHTVRSFTPLSQALEMLLKNRIGCLPVVDEGGRLVGIVTEGDAVRFAAQCLSRLENLAVPASTRLVPERTHALAPDLK